MYRKSKACDSVSLASMERASTKLLKKCMNPKTPEIELDGFTKLGPQITYSFHIQPHHLSHPNNNLLSDHMSNLCQYIHRCYTGIDR